MSPPLLKLRVREWWPIGQQRNSPDNTEPPIVEVLKDGQVIGQLPATETTYTMLPNQPGRITISLRATDVNIQTHD